MSLREGSPRDLSVVPEATEAHATGACILCSHFHQEPWRMLAEVQQHGPHVSDVCPHQGPQQTESPLGNQKGVWRGRRLTPPLNSTLVLVCFERIKKHDRHCSP